MNPVPECVNQHYPQKNYTAYHMQAMHTGKHIYKTMRHVATCKILIQLYQITISQQLSCNECQTKQKG